MSVKLVSMVHLNVYTTMEKRDFQHHLLLFLKELGKRKSLRTAFGCYICKNCVDMKSVLGCCFFVFNLYFIL